LLQSGTTVDPEKLNDEGKALRRSVHKTIRKVSEDIEERFHFNTAIAAIMELVNTVQTFEPKNDSELTHHSSRKPWKASSSCSPPLYPILPKKSGQDWDTRAVSTSAGWPAYDTCRHRRTKSC
jgi:leucyl-tRNA synthetase